MAEDGRRTRAGVVGLWGGPWALAGRSCGRRHRLVARASERDDTYRLV